MILKVSFYFFIVLFLVSLSYYIYIRDIKNKDIKTIYKKETQKLNQTITNDYVNFQQLMTNTENNIYGVL